ncbi:protease I [Saccharopolyspora erythraea NRRL 2338]|uniref:Protease I n=1 Tax=Saccharopolyspora erythraea (strain ATCC 11635 / DSM 40517 / JCM 4748 / NBRC 13426 / NCIMB 8594 / NRRL 2338) TaxID=405948 RepID=A4FDV5_SACEN|nr:type 1 glutamine amidotransferase domain-containing protein [Saccharopolyspora erythraea]PFG95961.1 protease I [Saccharopolyspora erythraea NRRL 2338]QRK92526.1 type 1 glutamine amidotransferase [Saccharopolyspora erythraea]CAM02230.1 protease I [Saccharopolyspora erythraea NRRL 2338]
MAADLNGRRIAVLATDGVEQVEYEQPRQAVEQAGGQVSLVSVHDGEIQAMNGDIDKGDRFTVDAKVSDVSPDDFDGLVLPGGTINPDRLRIDADAVGFVRSFVQQGKPVGAICHGPWTLVEADVVRGRRVTSFPSIRTDLRNAGAEVVDEQVVTDQGLVTSRNPDDLHAFCSKIVEEFAEGRHRAAAGA